METKSVLAITGMLYKRTENHAKVGGVLIKLKCARVRRQWIPTLVLF